MAVLQKIRNRGVLLVSIIALALFLFVIGDFLRGGEVLFNQGKQTAGEIAGTSVKIQDFDKYRTQFQYFVDNTVMQQQMTVDQVNDRAWQSYVQAQLVGAECEKLGISVSDEEVAEAIRSGRAQMLYINQFANQQTGFQYAVVDQFVKGYTQAKEQGQSIPEEAKKLYDYYMFAQEQTRVQLMMARYNALVSSLVLSNPVEAQANFKARTEQAKAVVVSLPFSLVKDDDVKVSDAEIKARYDERKVLFTQRYESRDIKYVDVAVVPSAKDRATLEEEMNGYKEKLASAASNKDAGMVVREATSLVQYADVYRSKDAFPDFIASQLEDSAALARGEVSAVNYDLRSNTFYTYKMLGQKQEADSVVYRTVVAIGKDAADSEAKADSILTALRGGADFKAIAKNYNQSGDSAIISTANYDRASLDADAVQQINTLYGMAVGESQKMKASNGVVAVMQVIDHKGTKTKYNIAAVVRELMYSSETYGEEYNKFSTFIASNPTMEKMEAAAAKSGYTVQSATISANQHHITNPMTQQGIDKTAEAIKWAFDTAEKGDVSQLYECGQSEYGHLLVVSLTGINPEGYTPLDKVKEGLRAEIANEKKAEKLIADCKNVSSLSAARAVKGALADTISNITLAAPAYVPSLRVSEPVLSAVATATAKGQFAKAVKGNNGVYMLQVLDKSKTAETYDAKTEQARASQTYAYGLAQQQMHLSDLYLKAHVKDYRYRFFDK